VKFAPYRWYLIFPRTIRNDRYFAPLGVGREIGANPGASACRNRSALRLSAAGGKENSRHM
jgi:hypothetical protein